MEARDKTMDDAMSVANYFIEKANESNTELTLLKLIKLVYLAHGYTLAILNRSFLSKYDRVEAWKFGPVIPSIYHSFKYNGARPITEQGIIVTEFEDSGEPELARPQVKDDIKFVLDFVWKRYHSWTASDLVSLLHKKGTPWDACFKPNENIEIPDRLTKMYYTAIFQGLVECGRKIKEGNGER